MKILKNLLLLIGLTIYYISCHSRKDLISKNLFYCSGGFEKFSMSPLKVTIRIEPDGT